MKGAEIDHKVRPHRLLKTMKKHRFHVRFVKMHAFTRCSVCLALKRAKLYRSCEKHRAEAERLLEEHRKHMA